MGNARTRHHDAWRQLIDSESLTPEQLRALRLRYFTMQTLQLFTPLRLEQIRTGKIPIEQAVQDFHLGQTALRNLQPDPDIYRGRGARKGAELAQRVAERLGRYWAQLNLDELGPYDTVLREIETHLSEADGYMIIFDNRPMSSAAGLWIGHAAAANLDGPILLASSLGFPPLPPEE